MQREWIRSGNGNADIDVIPERRCHPRLELTYASLVLPDCGLFPSILVDKIQLTSTNTFLAIGVLIYRGQIYCIPLVLR